MNHPVFHELLQRLAQMLDDPTSASHVAAKLRSLARMPYDPNADPSEWSAPKVDSLRHCLLCGRFNPWGTWDSKTGACVCISCREARLQRDHIRDTARTVIGYWDSLDSIITHDVASHKDEMDRLLNDLRELVE